MHEENGCGEVKEVELLLCVDFKGDGETRTTEYPRASIQKTNSPINPNRIINSLLL